MYLAQRDTSYKKLTLVGETVGPGVTGDDVGPGVTGPQFGLVAVDAHEMEAQDELSKTLA